MKKLIHLALAAAMIFGAASCSKENDLNGPAGDGNGTMTFELKGLSKITTYATVPTKTAAESDIVGAISVYMFKASDNKLVKAYTTGGTDCALSGQKVTISNLKDYMGQQMNFYVVANPTPTTAISVTPGTTTEADLIAKLTKKLGQTGGKISERLITPLLLTGKTTASVEVSSTATASISLKRSVARFDVVNPMADFHIDEIYVSRVYDQGYIFPQTALPGIIIGGGMAPIAGPVVADYETIGTERIARSVFYTYPMHVGPAGITVKAHFGASGTTKMYEINTNKDILANNRYKIVCQEVNGKVELSLMVVEWNEGEELALSEGEDNMVVPDNFVVSGGANLANLGVMNYADDTYYFTDNTGGTLTFDVYTKYGTNYSIEYVDGDQSDLTTNIAVVKSAPVITYGYETKDTYTVTIPKSLAAKRIDIKVHISSLNNPTVEPYHLSFAREFNIQALAQINPGLAEDLDGEFGPVLSYEDIHNTTYMHFDSAISTRGLNIFPNLEEIHISTVPGSAEGGGAETLDLDLSGCSNLKTVYVDIYEHTYMTADFSECPKLEEITIDGDCDLPSLNFSKNTKLKYVNIASNWQFMNLDFSTCPDLEDLSLGNEGISVNLTKNHKLRNLWLFGYIEEIDLSGCTGLEYLSFAPHSSYIEDIDLSKNTNLLQVSIISAPNLLNLDLTKNTFLMSCIVKECSSLGWIDLSNNRMLTDQFVCKGDIPNPVVYVWSDFPVGNPGSWFNGYDVKAGVTFVNTPRL